MDKWQIINLVILLIYLALIVGLEQVFREPMFKDSLEFQLNWQKKSPQLKGFMIFMSELGTGPILIPMFAITFIFFPINKSYSFLTVMIYGYFVDNILKLWYGNPRPFWLNPLLFQACNGGYGNPSGHSFSSISAYLSLWHIITDFDFFKNKLIGKVVRIALLILFKVIVILIILSRVFLGAHSTNQVLYGAMWGLALYFCVFFILQWPSQTSEEFFKIFREKKYIIIYSFLLLLFLLASILSYTFIDNEDYLYSSVLNLLCPDHSHYRKFNPNGLFGMLSLFGVIGGHYGLVLLFYLTEKNYPTKCHQIMYWHSKGNFKTNILRIILCIIFGLPLILIFLVSGKGSLTTIFIFKVSVPYCLGLFGVFGPGIYLSIKCKLANPEIYTIHAESNRYPQSELGLVDHKNNNEDISEIPKMKEDITNNNQVDKAEKVYESNNIEVMKKV